MRWIRIFGLVGLAFFFASAFTPLPNTLSRWVATPARLEPADAIVVLGGGLSTEGVPTNSSLRRALHGITLYGNGLAPLLVFLGPAPDHGPPEAEIRAQLAHTLGIPPQAILTEAGAWTTCEEAVRTRAFLWPKGVRRILLVTNSQHIVRAQRVFERAGFEVLPAPAEDLSSATVEPEGRIELMRRVLEELFARVFYRVAGCL